MSRSILVTGGGGFLGSNIVEDLVARGDRISILAREQLGWCPRFTLDHGLAHTVQWLSGQGAG